MGVAEDVIKGAAQALVPPQEDAPAGRITTWRWTIAVVLGGTVMLTSTHILYACGFLVAYGLPGFAQAQDINGLKQENAKTNHLIQMVQNDQKLIREGQLDNQIQGSRERQCKAIKANNDDAKSFATRQLQETLNSYYQLTGHGYYRLPDCSEL